ncbi:MAG: glycosyltransferase [Propionibacteriaceae bacterium]|jgi:glycosyltransferase involved in cell wall biosynthesis|nr:glycosyltransferase [Propionibacteriaceae bacterium]
MPNCPRWKLPIELGTQRIGIFSDDFYPESGGVSRSIQLQLGQLVEAGHEVVLFVPEHRLSPPTVGQCVGLPQWRMPGTPSYLCSLPVSAKLARAIADRYRLDVVHSQNERGSIFLAAMVAKLLEVPHAHTFHSNYVGTHLTTPTVAALNTLTYLPWASKRLAKLVGREYTLRKDAARFGGRRGRGLADRDWFALARFASQVDAFTSPAAYMVESIVAASDGSLTGRGQVVPSGVAEAFIEARRERPRTRTTRFISVGRLNPDKRVDVIVDAFARLGDDNAELVILGAGATERSLRRKAAQVTHGRVRFLGQVDDPGQLAQEIADADVFCLASYHFDTQGMVLAEAAAAGTPILYCDERLAVGVSAENALLCGHSVPEFAAGMGELAADPARRERMGAAGLRLVPGLTAQAMRDSYLAVYTARPNTAVPSAE